MSQRSRRTRRTSRSYVLCILIALMVLPFCLPERTIISAIQGYQAFSQKRGFHVCRYSPSCSHYAIGCIEEHGKYLGLLESAWRIARCNPWSKGGYDPVRKRGARARGENKMDDCCATFLIGIGIIIVLVIFYLWSDANRQEADRKREEEKERRRIEEERKNAEEKRRIFNEKKSALARSGDVVIREGSTRMMRCNNNHRYMFCDFGPSCPTCKSSLLCFDDDPSVVYRYCNECWCAWNTQTQTSCPICEIGDLYQIRSGYR